MQPPSGFGIPQLDALLGTLPTGGALLLSHEPGLQADAFVFQSARAHLRAGIDVVYVTTSRAPSAVVKGMEEAGFGVDGAARTRLHFVDAFSALMATTERAPYTVTRPDDAAAVADAISRAVKEHPRALVLIDSLSGLVDHAGWAPTKKALGTLTTTLSAALRSLVLFTLWPYEERLDEFFQAFPSHVQVKAVEDRVAFSQYFQVRRAAGQQQVDSAPRVYRVIPPAGIVVFVPKIVITGPSGAGKSTFLRAACETSTSVDRGGTTVALDHGRITTEGLVADVFGTPGEARFDPILSTIAAQALGVLVLVDASRPDTFDRAKQMLDKTWKQGLPAVVVANKSDLPDALRATEVARRMALPAYVRTVACSGRSPQESRRVLRDLLDQILRRSVAP